MHAVILTRYHLSLSHTIAQWWVGKRAAGEVFPVQFLSTADRSSRGHFATTTTTNCNSLLVGGGGMGENEEGEEVVELDTRFSQDDEPYGGTGTCSLSSLKNALSSLQMVRTSSSPLYFPSKLSPLAPCLPRPMGEFVCAHVCVCVFS